MQDIISTEAQKEQREYLYFGLWVYASWNRKQVGRVAQGFAWDD